MNLRRVIQLGAVALTLIGIVWTISCFTPAAVLKRNLYGMSAVPSFSGVHERRRGSAEYIQNLGPDVVPQLIPYLQQHDSELRCNAARALLFFPERREESIGALVAGLEAVDSNDLITLRVFRGVLKGLLQPSDQLPSVGERWLDSSDTYRRMVAVDLALHMDPNNETARTVLLELLKPIDENRDGNPSTAEIEAAYSAVQVLREMNDEDRSFALDELTRIASISDDYARSNSSIGRLRDQIVELIQGLEGSGRN
jgi:hypothetical protein